MTVNVSLQDIKKIETDALIVGFYENVRPLKNLAGELDWLLCGSLSNLIIKHKLRGSLGDVALLTSQGKVPASKIFMVGLGSQDAVSPEILSSAARTAIASVLNAGVKKAAIECFSGRDLSWDISARAVHRGLSEPAGNENFEITILAPDAGAYDKISKVLKS